jgi:hypothetical protein
MTTVLGEAATLEEIEAVRRPFDQWATIREARNSSVWHRTK